MLGIGVSAASVRLHRAKAALQAVIEGGALMNESEWNELQRLWKSCPAQAEPVAVELERLGRRRRWFAVEVVIEAVIAVAGLGVGVG